MMGKRRVVSAWVGVGVAMVALFGVPAALVAQTGADAGRGDRGERGRGHQIGLTLGPGAQRGEGVAWFQGVDLIVEPTDDGALLGAYQVQIGLPRGVSLVGVEGGAHPAFADPPYYDPEALHAADVERVIVAGFSLDDELPGDATRVARLHFRIDAGGRAVTLIPELMGVGDGAGERIGANVWLVRSDGDGKPDPTPNPG
ncbi:MAG: hypothetical protein ACTS3F_04565 [Phycisphaerales bacterium]